MFYLGNQIPHIMDLFPEFTPALVCKLKDRTETLASFSNRVGHIALSIAMPVSFWASPSSTGIGKLIQLQRVLFGRCTSAYGILVYP